MKTKKILCRVGKSMPWLLALTMLLTFAAIPASADGTPETKCIDAAADTFTVGNEPNATSHALDQVLQVANQTGANIDHTFLRFDLSAIPPGSTIISADLKLYMEQPPTVFKDGTVASRTYKLYWTQDFLNGTTTLWDETNANNGNMPALQSQVGSVDTGDSAGLVTWSVLPSRVQIELDGDNMISFEIEDNANINGNLALLSKFTSRNSTTANAKPQLCVTYTPPENPSSACEGVEDPLIINASYHTAANTVCLGTRYCFDVEFVITACEDLDKVKVQGGIGGNLDVESIEGYINDELQTTNTPTSKNPGNSTNTLITWNIDQLKAGDVATIKVQVCTGKNPQDKQEFTSCGINPITGAWSASAVLSGTKTKVKSVPEYTEPLLVDVTCPCPE